MDLRDSRERGTVPGTVGNLSGEAMIHDTPVLLLDDVLSELDSSRQNYLLKSIKEIQTLITCTGLDDFVNHQFRINRVFRVFDGRVFQNKLGGAA